MRVIYKASLVFLLKDIYSKMPITTAVILCNGKQNPYTRKPDGHYVFSNLYPGTYDISISAKGYTDINFTAQVRENETRVMSFDMPYAVDNANLTHVTRFEILVKDGKEPLANADITLKLKNEASFLKLTEPSEAGSNELKLNIDMVSGLLGQQYVYRVKKQDHNIYLYGYDSDKKCYFVENPLEQKLESEGKFYPCWNIQTDAVGRAVMPLISQFMKDDVIKFECTTSSGKKAGISADIAGKHQAGEVIYLTAKLRKSAERK